MTQPPADTETVFVYQMRLTADPTGGNVVQLVSTNRTPEILLARTRQFDLNGEEWFAFDHGAMLVNAAHLAAIWQVGYIGPDGSVVARVPGDGPADV